LGQQVSQQVTAGANAYVVGRDMIIAGHESPLNRELRQLRSDVGRRGALEQLKLLAGSGHLSPADVGFTPPDVVTWRSDGDQGTGSLSGIASFYDSLPKGRLLILGAAASGKTVLAGQLLIELAKRDVPGQPVPVRLSLPSFDPGSDHDEATPDIVAARLDAWVSQQLRDVYGVTPTAARGLVEESMLVLVLDGLDEMDGELAWPSRAAAVLRALNHPATWGLLRRVVVTCQSARYEHLARANTAPGRDAFLQDAAVIRLQPLTAAKASDYITTRFPDSTQPGGVQARWQPVLAHLADEPRGPLARALASPLRLFMAVTLHHSPSSNPVELTRLTESQVDEYLFTGLVRAVITQRPLPGASDADVSRWLGTLSRYLAEQQRRGGSGTDIDLHLLWIAAGQHAPRTAANVVRSFIAALACAPASWLIASAVRYHSPIASHIVGVAIGLVILGIGMRLATIPASRPVDLRRLDLSQLRSGSGRRRLRASAVTGLRESLSVPWASGYIAMPLAAVLNAVTHRAGAVGHPREIVRQGLACEFTLLAMPLLAYLPFACLSTGTPSALDTWAFAGLSICPMLWFTARSPWLPYFTGCLMLARQGQLPYRPARFLDWAYDAGLMRMSGISIQFRHRDLQAFLLKAAPPDRLKKPL
jgi:NACHT domain